MSVRAEDAQNMVNGLDMRRESDTNIRRQLDYYATTQATYVLVLTDADTEYGQVLPANTRSIEVFARNGAAIRISLVAGKTADATSTTSEAHWIQATTTYSKDHLKLNGKTLYVASSTAATPVQITCWTG